MEIFELIIKVLEIIVWPSVVIIIMLVFKNSLSGLFTRLTKANLPGDVTLSFAEGIKELEEVSERVKNAPPKEGITKISVKNLTLATPDERDSKFNSRLISLGLRPSPSGLDMEYYKNLTYLDPTLALAGLRIEIDLLARNLAKGFNISINKRETGASLIRKLYASGAITREQMDLTHKVLSLCNMAVHGEPVTRSNANNIIEIAEILSSDYKLWLSWGFDDNWKPKVKL